MRLNTGGVRRAVGVCVAFVALASLIQQFSALSEKTTAFSSRSSEHFHPSDRDCVFTISAFNNFGFVQAFFENVRVHNPEYSCFIWVVADNGASWAKGAAFVSEILDSAPEWLQVVTADKLQTVMDFSYLELAFRYDLQCFSTAIKPAAFSYIFDRLNAQKVLFFDNDVWIKQPLDEILRALDKYSFVLTPHLTEPYPIDGLLQDERNIMNAGQFNFGFVALARSKLVSEMLSWWAERLRYYGFGEPSKGMHFDQNWAGLIPSYFDQSEYLILRDPRYNIAYWNLHYRGKHIRIVNEEVLYDGVPVVFLHFSGLSALETYDIEEVSRHQNRITMSDYEHLRPVFESYLNMLAKKDAMHWRFVPYGFKTFDNGQPLPPIFQSYFREITDPSNWARSDARLFKAKVDTRDLFASDTKQRTSFLSWMLECSHHLLIDTCFANWVPEFLWQIYRIRPDLQNIYPKPFDLHSHHLVEWFIVAGHSEYEALAWIVPLVEEEAARAERENAAAIRLRGVNVFGWLDGVWGVGHSSRLVYASLVAQTSWARLPVAALLLPRQSEHQHQAQEVAVTRTPQYYFNIFVANAINTPEIKTLYPRAEYTRHYNIALMAWELEDFPREWMQYVSAYDEVWTPSRFVTRSIMRCPLYTGTPVRTMPFGLDLNPREYKADRSRFGFADDTFIFLVAFDLLSCIERKNPVAAIRAFKKAFGTSSQMLLILKVMNVVFEKSGVERLRQEIGSNTNIRVMTEKLPKHDLYSFYASIDVFVSLHRSEGFGLVLLEMMMLGKPVIATNYSGNLEFMSAVPGEFEFTLINFEYSTVNTSGRFRSIYTNMSRWAEPNVEEASRAMKQLTNRSFLRRYAQLVSPHIRDGFSTRAAGLTMARRLRELSARFKLTSS